MTRPPAGDADRSLHLLLMALVGLLIVKPVADLDLIPPRATSFALIVVMVAGVYAVARSRRRHYRTIAAIGVALILAHGAALLASGPIAEISAAVISIGILTLLSWAVLRRTFAPGRITMRRIEGAIASYMLVGLLFASAYDLVEVLAPGAFSVNGVVMTPATQQAHFAFFSFVTLTTTGYGDMVPLHPVARSLAVLEMVTGQVFIAVLLARLVSLEIAHRDRPPDPLPVQEEWPRGRVEGHPRRPE